MRPSSFLSAADPPQSVVSKLSHDSPHTSQAVCDSVSVRTVVPGGTSLEKLSEWTGHWPWHRAPSHRKKSRWRKLCITKPLCRAGYFFLSTVFVLYLPPNVIIVYISSVTQYTQYSHILARLPKFCSFLCFSTIRTSPQDKYLVSAGGAGWLRCSLMSVSRSIQLQVFSVHGALLTRNSSAYAGKHSHGSQNKLCRSRQTRRSEQIVQQVTAGSLPCKCTH